MSTPTLAACVITRNGAGTIGEMLASVRPHVDEVCVLDTGSTDDTLELVAAVAATEGAPIRVERCEWPGDFSAARTCSFAMARSDYLLAIDDDEILHGGTHIRPILELNRPDAIQIRVVDRIHYKIDWWRTVVRAGVGEWRGRIHEELELPTLARVVAVDPKLTYLLHEPVAAPGRHDYAVPTREMWERFAARVAQQLAPSPDA